MAAQDPLVFEIDYSTPRGKPLHPYLRSSHVKAEIETEFMLRLVDVEGALKHLDGRTAEPLVLDVSDDVIPENAGEYTVGDGEVIRGAEAEARVNLDVRRLAQLYAGYLSAEDLHRNGCVKASSPEALELLGSCFPPGDPWVFPPDHF
jgi:predicted acetyltransferase